MRAFQQKRALRPDGVVGPKTWAEIDELDLASSTQPAGADKVGTDKGEVSTAGGVDVTGVPRGARRLLDFIADYEAPSGYDTIYGNNQDRLPKPLTQMTVAEVISAGPEWKRAFRSPACGRYQFMTYTLESLKTSEGLNGAEIFDAAQQDTLGFALLRRRGYAKYMDGQRDRVAFGLALAQEWASFPVLTDCRGAHRFVKRGETYYAGDGLNKALVSPEKVELVLDEVRTLS